MMEIKSPVPQALRNWFVVHFIVDLLFALPLFFIPESFLSFLGWTVVDSVASRLVAAALFGIGIESLLGRGANWQSFRTMLNLKIIWSFSAVAGLLWAVIAGVHGAPPALWGVLLVFMAFNGLWIYWRVRLNADAPMATRRSGN